MFYIILTASVLTILSTNIRLKIIWMILSFLLTAIFLILQGVDFLGILYLIIYVGAISILFLFVHMNDNHDGANHTKGHSFRQVGNDAKSIIRQSKIGPLLSFIPIIPNIEIIERHELVENIGSLLYGEFSLFNFLFCFFLLAVMIPVVSILRANHT